jgi:hypothetical protein
MPKSLRDELPEGLQSEGWLVNDSGALHRQALSECIPLKVARNALAMSEIAGDLSLGVLAIPCSDRPVLRSGHYTDVLCICGRRLQTLMEVDLANALMRPIFDILGGLTLLRVPTFCVCMFGENLYEHFTRFDLETCAVTRDPEPPLFSEIPGTTFELPVGCIALGGDEWERSGSPTSQLGGIQHWYRAERAPVCTTPGCDGGTMLLLACVEIPYELGAFPDEMCEDGNAILVFVCTHCCRQGAVAFDVPP